MSNQPFKSAYIQGLDNTIALIARKAKEQQEKETKVSEKPYVVYAECPNCYHKIRKTYATKRGAKCAYTRMLNRFNMFGGACQRCKYEGVYNYPYRSKLGYEFGWYKEIQYGKEQNKGGE